MAQRQVVRLGRAVPRVYSRVGAKGDFAKADRLVAAFAAFAASAIPLTSAAAEATQQVSAKAFDAESEPTGRRWAALAPSTLRRRKPGKKLAGLLPARVLRILGQGRWSFVTEKEYDEYHTTGTQRMPARPDMPVQPGGMLLYGDAIGKAIERKMRDVFRQFGVSR